MNKSYTLLFLFFLFQIAFLEAQPAKKLTVFVKDILSKQPLQNVLVQVSDEKGNKERLFTDMNGIAVFKNLHNKNKYKASVINTQLLSHNYLYGFLRANEFEFSVNKDSVNGITHNFNLNPILCKIKQLNTVNFSHGISDKFDSRSSINDVTDTLSNETALHENFKIIKEELPDYIFEIAGHASWNEKDPDLLSEKRAKHVYDRLVAMGIPEKQITFKGYGTSQQVLSEKMCKKMRGKEREEACLRNRRVALRISHKNPLFATFKGLVTDCRTNQPIPEALVVLTSGKNSLNSVKTDSFGIYQFKMELKPSIYELNIIAPEVKKKAYSSKCGLGGGPYGYLNSGNKSKIEVGDSLSSTHYINKFCLSPILAEMRFPGVNFKKNDTIFHNYFPNYETNADTELDCLAETMANNPNITIELMGHAGSDEKKPQLLSERRALLVKRYLSTKGVAEDRMVAKGYGIKRLIVLDQDVSKLKTPEEKEAAFCKNRRVVFSVLRKDYGLPKNDEE